jgi:hypothetical protein
LTYPRAAATNQHSVFTSAICSGVAQLTSISFGLATSARREQRQLPITDLRRSLRQLRLVGFEPCFHVGLELHRLGEALGHGLRRHVRKPFARSASIAHCMIAL